MTATRLRISPARRRQLLPALLAWLLLTLQVPWHTGMQAGGHDAGAAPDYARLAATLGLTCGPAPDAATFEALLAAGLVEPAQLAAAQDANTHGGDSLCKLFSGLVAPLDIAVAFTVPVQRATPTPVAVADLLVSPPAFRQPPARAPPSMPA